MGVAASLLQNHVSSNQPITDDFTLVSGANDCLKVLAAVTVAFTKCRKKTHVGQHRLSNSLVLQKFYGIFSQICALLRDGNVPLSDCLADKSAHSIPVLHLHSKPCTSSKTLSGRGFPDGLTLTHNNLP